MLLISSIFYWLIFETFVDGKKIINILNTSKYLTFGEQSEFLETLARLAPKSMELKIAGTTEMPGKDYANNIYVAQVGNPTNPMLFFDCGAHPREWLPSATCLYIIQKLVLVFEYERAKKLRQPSPVLNYLWSIIPNLNPDGYNITFTGNRMHRKNGRPVHLMKISDKDKKDCAEVCQETPSRCIGVDINRNFPAGWGLGNPNYVERGKRFCGDMYTGPEPLSEPEARALHNYVTANRHRMLSAISIHSYIESIFYPLGWLPDDHPDQVKGEERKLLIDFATYFNQELGYKIGNTATLSSEKQLAGGATDDYYYKYQHFNICYTIELEPWILSNSTEDSLKGFQPPPQVFIKKTGKRLWRAFQRMAEKLGMLYNNNSSTTASTNNTTPTATQSSNSPSLTTTGRSAATERSARTTWTWPFLDFYIGTTAVGSSRNNVASTNSVRATALNENASSGNLSTTTEINISRNTSALNSNFQSDNSSSLLTVVSDSRISKADSNDCTISTTDSSSSKNLAIDNRSCTSTTDDSSSETSTTDNSSSKTLTTDNSSSRASTIDKINSKTSIIDNTSSRTSTNDGSSSSTSTIEKSSSITLTTDNRSTGISTTDNNLSRTSTTDSRSTRISTTDNSSSRTSTIDSSRYRASATDNSNFRTSTTDSSSSGTSTPEQISRVTTSTDSYSSMKSTTEKNSSITSTTDSTRISSTDNSSNTTLTTDIISSRTSTIDSASSTTLITDSSSLRATTIDSSSYRTSTTDKSSSITSTTDSSSTRTSTIDGRSSIMSTVGGSSSGLPTTDSNSSRTSTTDSSSTRTSATDSSTSGHSITDSDSSSVSTPENIGNRTPTTGNNRKNRQQQQYNFYKR